MRISDRAKRVGQSISRYLIENALREEAMTFDQKEHAEAVMFQRDWANIFRGPANRRFYLFHPASWG